MSKDMKLIMETFRKLQAESEEVLSEQLTDEVIDKQAKKMISDAMILLKKAVTMLNRRAPVDGMPKPGI